MDRTYVFNSDGNAGGGSRIDINSLLPGMAGRSIDPGLLALMNNGNGFGGQNGIWGVIYLAIICSIFGWNNGGGFFGGRGCNAGQGSPELVTSLLNRNETAIGQLAQSLGCSTQQVQTALANIENSVGLTGTQIINAIQSGNNGVVNQLSTCCCNILQAVERQGAATQLQNCQNMNALTSTMNSNTLSLRDGATANTNAILAKLDAMQNQALQDKIAQLTAEKATLQSEISQRNQNATILNSVGQQIAPLVAGLQALQSDVDGIKCKLPNTVSVPYPQLQVYNPEVARAAAFGAAAGGYAGYGCGYNGGFWG